MTADGNARDWRRIGTALLLAAVMAAGCTRSGPPAPVDDRARRSGTLAQAASSVYVIVERGDTVWAIAQRHNTTTRGLIDVNGLRPPYHLQPGQRLWLPDVGQHVVAAGDTVYGVSRRYGVDASELARLNALQAPYTIFVGQRLRLPPNPAQRVAPLAPPPPATVQTAQGRVPVPMARPGSGPLAVASAPPPAALAPVPHAPVSQVPASPAAAPAAPQSGSLAMPEPPPADGRGFLWPVRGDVVSGFGSKGGGLHNDGINIAAPRGTPVRAAQSGVVVYAGNELRGFGNLLLVRHDGGWVTAYAHNDELLVPRGATVHRGDIIARVGSTGNVDTPQLHFELRRGSTSVDPARHLGTGQQAGSVQARP